MNEKDKSARTALLDDESKAIKEMGVVLPTVDDVDIFGNPVEHQVHVTLTLKVESPEAWKHIQAAERHLLEAGISFDTGIGAHGRDWELDWSLEGAVVRNPREPRAGEREKDCV